MNDFLRKIIPSQTSDQIQEQITQYLDGTKGFCHIVSLNPEIVMEARKDPLFSEVIRAAQMRIIDGVGVLLASKFLGISAGHRFTGVDLMEFLLTEASNRRSRVLLLGGRENIAERIVECQRKAGSKASFLSMRGFLDKNNPTKTEEIEIESRIVTFKPQIILVSFGSPFQEKWIHAHKGILGDSVCAGVGGAFDFLSGEVRRAPRIVRLLGAEWLFRLFVQPWRVKRQMRLLLFTLLVIKERIT